MKTIIGNWKMHGTSTELGEVVRIADRAGALAEHVEVWLCLPAPLLSRAAATVGDRPLGLGGQTCHPAKAGAHTGDISAEMLLDAGARLTLVGHSERRQDHHEGNALVRAQAYAALDAGLSVVVCIGETSAERQSGRALEVISFQLTHSLPTGHRGLRDGRVLIAYEPIWAIGSGRTPSQSEIAQAHAHMRAECRAFERSATPIRLLYGGSVKPDNAANILSVANVDGVLVGGASLKAADFGQIMQSATTAALANAS